MFTPEKRTVSKFQRENVRITPEYVDGIMKWITERDIAILRLLLDHPFLTIEQIEMMMLADLKPSSWRNKANERLRRLYHSHCIDRWFPPVSEGAGSSQQHLILDKVGAIVLAKHLGYDPKNLKWRKRNYIPQTYSHTLKILDFKAMLNILNRQVGIIDSNPVGEVLYWQQEHQAKAVFKREDGKKGEIIPDALCVYKTTAAGGLKLFYLEVDNATEGLEQLQSKIRAYVDFFRSGEWKSKGWGKTLQRFPTIIILFHDEETAEELRKYAKRIKSNVRFLFSTYDKLLTREVKVYENKLGKRREVLQSIHVNLLESIWKDNRSDDYTSL